MVGCLADGRPLWVEMLDKSTRKEGEKIPMRLRKQHPVGPRWQAQLYLCGLALLSPQGTVLAAPLPPAATCEIAGTIVATATRREPCANASLCASWGTPAYQDYTDVTVRLESQRPAKKQRQPYLSETDLRLSCADTPGTTIVFQSGDGSVTAAHTDARITATTHRSGDEFRSGHWIYNIQPAQDTAVDEAP